MSIRQISSNQYRWRRWSGVYPHLGDLSGRRVLDLGCGVGDQARDLSGRGAHVLGIDASQDVIDHASRRAIPGARFLCENIRNLKEHELECEGIWASFTAAYFPQFNQFLDCIDTVLKPAGWLAITEVDDLFGHGPLAWRWVDLVEQYYSRSLEEGIYRFRCHDHVHEVLSRAGWRIEIDRKLEDDEFCFAGPADPDVVDAWKTRLGFMMPRFVGRFGTKARGFDSAFLQCLASEEHRSQSSVWFILARPPDDCPDARDRPSAG
jgi:SAM-dependent methyltransferase